LVLGVGALVGALLSLRYSQQVENRQIIVDCSVWYWHSMGVFWIFLFTLLAFFQ
jgi:cytochrome c oxidase subunit 3